MKHPEMVEIEDLYRQQIDTLTRKTVGGQMARRIERLQKRYGFVQKDLEDYQY
jgi:hypothetical protein